MPSSEQNHWRSTGRIEGGCPYLSKTIHPAGQEQLAHTWKLRSNECSSRSWWPCSVVASHTRTAIYQCSQTFCGHHIPCSTSDDANLDRVVRKLGAFVDFERSTIKTVCGRPAWRLLRRAPRGTRTACPQWLGAGTGGRRETPPVAVMSRNGRGWRNVWTLPHGLPSIRVLCQFRVDRLQGVGEVPLRTANQRHLRTLAPMLNRFDAAAPVDIS